MLLVGFREMVFSGAGVISVEVVVGILWVQGGGNAVLAGVGNGSGGQTLIGVGVIGMVDLQILRCQIGLAVQCVDDGGIDVQIGILAGIIQTVVDDRGDFKAFGNISGFLFNHGGDDDDLPNGVAVQIFQLFLHDIRKGGIKGVQHLLQHTLRLVVFVEVVGVGEQVALQTVLITTLYALQEPVFIQLTIGGVCLQLGYGADFLFFQKLEDLGTGVAFRDTQILYDLQAASAGGHDGYQRHVVVDDGLVIFVDGGEIVSAGLDLLLRVRKVCVELEQAGILDQTGILQLLGDGIHVIAFVDGHGGGFGLTAQSQHICGAQPSKTAHRYADSHDDHQPNDSGDQMGQAQQTVAFFSLGTTLFHGQFLLIFFHRSGNGFLFRGRGHGLITEDLI